MVFFELKVLLFDEPTSALDPLSTENIKDALMKLNKNRGMTVIMVPHLPKISSSNTLQVTSDLCYKVDLHFKFTST